MPFCPSCGKTVSANAKFCYECGDSVSFVEDNSTRRQEFIGKIAKCPSCGSGIPSFTAICPSCSHEINSVRVSSSIKDFTEQITQCDFEIAHTQRPVEAKKGWSTWGTWGKIGWVILNIYTMFIPIIISLVFPKLSFGKTQDLTPAEKKKIKIIDNFVFPNDRENILEALLFIKFQVATLASGRIDGNTEKWIKVWNNKAHQLFEKAEIMFKGDKIAADTYKSLLAYEDKVKKMLRLRLTLVIGIILLLFVLSMAFGNDASQSPTTVIRSPLLASVMQIK